MAVLRLDVPKGVIRKFQSIVEDNPDFANWRADNLRDKIEKPTRSEIWWAIASARTTSMQKSGEGSSVSRLMHSYPYLLRLSAWNSEQDLVELIEQHGGMRFANRIAKDLVENRKLLDEELVQKVQSLSTKKQKAAKQISRERGVAKKLQNLAGIGPKQSRNVLQLLGLTRYEIPLDSRVAKWLNNNRIFPFSISAELLQDPGFYDYLLDCIQEICVQADVYPCLFDQAVFSSFDKKG